MTTVLTTFIFRFFAFLRFFASAIFKEKALHPLWIRAFVWSKWRDSNPRPFGPEPHALSPADRCDSTLPRTAARFDYRFDYQTAFFQHFVGLFLLPFAVDRTGGYIFASSWIGQRVPSRAWLFSGRCRNHRAWYSMSAGDHGREFQQGSIRTSPSAVYIHSGSPPARSGSFPRRVSTLIPSSFFLPLMSRQAHAARSIPVTEYPAMGRFGFRLLSLGGR